MAIVYRGEKWFNVGRVRGGTVPIADWGKEIDAPPPGSTIYQGLSDTGADDALDALGIEWEREAAMDPAWTTIKVAGGEAKEPAPPVPYRVRCTGPGGEVLYDFLAV